MLNICSKYSYLTIAALLFLVYTGVAVAGANDGTCEAAGSCSGLLNSAFVFIKPHANTPKTQALVKDALTRAGITILSESEISGETIDKEKLIDKHYFAIASKATILSPKDFPVPADRFQEAFGESWADVLAEKRAANAMEACTLFDCSPDELDEAWRKAEKENLVIKLGGGFYCGLVSVGENRPALYVFNAFFMSMRSKFIQKGTSIHCYEVEWQKSTLTWSSFRSDLVGPTDPESAPEGSIRRTILDRYSELGLKSRPNKGDNGVHASASPLEGLAEKTNWLHKELKKDPFGKALLDSGVEQKAIEEWSLDAQVKLDSDTTGSIFDYLEDMDADECLQKMVELHKLRQAN